MNKTIQPRRTVTLGNFDGVHLGHSALLRELRRGEGIKTVYSFLRHTRAGAEGFLRLYPCVIDDMLLRESGASEILRVDFDRVRSMTPADFVRRELFPLRPVSVVCGEDFRFGAGGSGDARLLGRLLADAGVSLVIVPPVRLGDDIVSTTLVKNRVRAGDMQGAAALLGREYFIRARVVDGKKLGRRIGTSTANLPLYEGCVEPRHGVYACRCEFDGMTRAAVANVGVRPTVDNDGKANAEVFLFDFDGDLYGRELTLRLAEFIRDERRFDSISDLASQIEKDKQAAVRLLG